jgi:high-affinity iron transporter
MSPRLSLLLGAALASVVLAGSGSAAQAQATAGPKDAVETLRQVAGILDYIGGDYRGSVGADGSIHNASEYAEQRSLASDASALAAHAGLGNADPLRTTLDDLTRALHERRSPEQVERLCRQARETIVVTHHIDLAPASAPSRELAERLYKSQGCNVCHGDDGGAHTAAAAALDPKPANFLDPARVATVSAHRAFHAISFGVPGTGMRSYAALSDGERWSLAFYVLALRHLNADTASGRHAFELAHKPAPVEARGLSALTEEELAAKLATIASPEARADALAYLRAAAPFARGQHASMARAYQQLDAGLLAYRRGDQERARRLFISAYLDGVEPHEASLRAHDSQLVAEIETAMLKLRTLAARGVREPQLEAAVERARALLDRAHNAQSNADTALIGAITITLREGVEIVLLVAALLGLVRKRGYPELAKYVHAGWLLAIPAGLLTFFAAESVLSGMQRELAEGLASILAALVLLGVTHWLLGQLGAKRWVGFLADRMGSATRSKSAALGVLSLAFVAAYREAFEIVLFFQALVLDAEDNARQVWLGAGLGLALLGAVAFFLLRVGQRLRPAPFMLASSICLALLSFVLLGKGMRALQAAAIVPASHLGLPDLPVLGVYATGEGLAAQGLLLALLLFSVLLPLRQARLAASNGAAAAE